MNEAATMSGTGKGEARGCRLSITAGAFLIILVEGRFRRTQADATCVPQLRWFGEKGSSLHPRRQRASVEGATRLCSGSFSLCVFMPVKRSKPSLFPYVGATIMEQVWKYPIHMQDSFELEMPQGAQILFVAVQKDAPCLWARVDSARKLWTRRFIVRGTGHPIDVLPASHVGSFMLHGGTLVFHLFEVV